MRGAILTEYHCLNMATLLFVVITDMFYDTEEVIFFSS